MREALTVGALAWLRRGVELGVRVSPHVELRREAVLGRGARGIDARQGLGKVQQQGGPAGRGKVDEALLPTRRSAE
jgi:hypothetical protein